MSLSLTVLGSNAAMPGHGRITSSQILHSDNHLYMIDCGEGCQIRLSQYKIKRNQIDAIFISHLHGDHVYGLPGVLSSYFHFQRTNKLDIFGPPGLKRMIHTLMEIVDARTNFELNIHEITPTGKQLVFSNNDVDVFTFPMKHRIQTNGYLFKEKEKPRNISKQKIQAYNLTVAEIKKLKAGEDVSREAGITILADDVLLQARSSESYAYCSDTVYDPELIKFIEGVDLLYHETTYLHELVDKAADRMHSTSLQAAQIAELVSAKKLMIGHYSGMYRKPDLLLTEAKTIFPNTVAGYDGLMVDIIDRR